MGLADPGAGAALSLNVITYTLLIHRPDFDSLARLRRWVGSPSK